MDDKVNAIKTGLVSAPCAAALLAGMERAKAKLVAQSDHYYDDDPEIDEVPSVGHDGFAPYTNGGYDLEVRGHISAAAETGRYPAQVQFYVEQYIEAEAQYESADDEDVDDPSWADGFYRYQVRALVFLKDNYRNQSGEDEVLIYGGINPFTPGTHGERTEDVYEATLSLAGLTPEQIEAAFDRLIAAFDYQWTAEGRKAFKVADAARRAKKQADDAAAREYWSQQA